MTRHDATVIMAFLSSRVRTWVLFAVLLPLVGRVLEAVGLRVGAKNPTAGRALTSAGGYARRPTPGMRRAHRSRYRP
ncbi:MAG: hypothetical protein H7323_16540 [Frankiales bacterium]|nr:hypothetical protein [Frankiales bacterium]